MDSPILKQIAKFLHDRKQHKHWTVIFTCLAILVGLGTVTALKLMGQAMTRKEKVLNCSLEVHAHTEECQDEAGNLICGLADYVVHVHNDDCYDSDGNLACVLPEIPAHVHAEECWAEEEVLICGFEEDEGHVHDDTCYEEQVTGLQCQSPEHQHGTGCYDETGSLTCTAAEHQHASECYDGAGNLICGQESHTHMVSCYDKDNNLTCATAEHQHDAECLTVEEVQMCGLEEGADGHTHTKKCYEKQQVLACGQLELHTHTIEAGCFEEIPPAEEGAEPIYNLICGIPVLEEHIHSEEAGCFIIVESVVADALESVNSTEAAPEEAVDATEAIDSTEMVAENSTETEEEEFFKACETDQFIVSAAYGAEAEIPEEAELVAELITPESDPEHYAEREAEYKEQVGDEDAAMSALLKIGFYLDGEEIEPKAPVQVTVQLVDENGLPEGMPMTVVHFAEEGSRVLEGSQVEGGKTRFETDSFSDFAFGANTKAKIPIEKTCTYTDGAFEMTFHLEGRVELPEGAIDSLTKKNEDNTSGVTEAAGDAAVTQADTEAEDTEVPAESDTEQPTEAEEEAAETETGSVDGSEGNEESAEQPQTEDANPASAEADGEDAAEAPVENAGEVALEDMFQLEVNPLDESSEEYKEIVKFAEESNMEGSELLSIQAVSYSLTFQGEKVDIKNCEVTVEVTPTKKLSNKAKKSMAEAVAYLLDSDDLTEEQSNITGIEIAGIERAADGTMNLNGDAAIDDAEELEKLSVTSVMNSNEGIFAARASGQPNPKFTVQYYVNLNRLAETGTNALTLIDTTGGKLPTNKGNTTKLPTGKNKNIYVDNNGNIQITKKLTEVYSSRNFEYYKAPTINYMNALVENTNYELKEVWILKSGKKADSTNKTDWDVHTYDADFHFTNREVSATSGKYILIKDNAVIRFVYDTTTKDKDFASAFYDYDISNGRVHRAKPPTDPDQYAYKTAGETFSGDSLTSEVLNWAKGLSNWDGHLYAYTMERGINSSENYNGSGTKLAFGNVNTGTNLGRLTWSKDNQNNELNKYNNKGYQGCTFGLVTGMSNGKIQYASNINAPKLFNEGSATGKESYDENQYSLKFNRVGDTYTLSAVNGTGATNLGNFSNPTNSTGTHTDIWTNNFWPMDSAPSFGTGTHDVKFGATATFKGGAHEIRFGPITQKDQDYTFPESDDGKHHNSYFGMHYEVEFDLVKDYIGPLEYYFFGDDDMWVFLDGTLVCDIGGVHSSVGEYVNLWDYLPKGSEGSHTLSFFYTERGASGSTCWMQFTLPSVSSLTPETTDEDYGELKIEKTVTQINNGIETVVDNDDEFSFTINFTDVNGNKLPDDYSYLKYDKDGNEIGHDLIIWDGGSFTLKNGEYIIVKYLPQGTKYTITEANTALTITSTDDETGEETTQNSKVEYFTDITVGNNEKKNLLDDKIAEGEIPKGNTSEVKYNNKFYLYELPKTGGLGKTPYTMAGIITMFGAGLLYRKKFRERRV